MQVPRLTKSHYLFLRNYLREVGIEGPRPFAMVSSRDQRYLHDLLPAG